MKRVDETLGLEALQRLRAQAVDEATSSVARAARALVAAEEALATARSSVSKERGVRAETLAAEAASSRAVRAEDLVLRGAWLSGIDAQIERLERALASHQVEAQRALESLEAAKAALGARRADLRVIEARLEASVAAGARARELSEEEDALELHVARRA